MRLISQSEDASQPDRRSSRWDIYCRVVDNFGDIGVCWRLARQLASEQGLKVRLWVDCLATFSRLCPDVSQHVARQELDGVEVCLWTDRLAATAAVETAEVVIEAFACDLPAAVIEAMIKQAPPPRWINLEYLSAEAWVEDCHGLPSPQAGGRLTKHFFFPGFTERTGGLIREKGLESRRRTFLSDQVESFWSALQVPNRQPSEVRASLFCYQNPALPELLDQATRSPVPVRLLVPVGLPSLQVARWAGIDSCPGATFTSGSLTVQILPFLEQTDYDRLLWACELNFVRGEDSFVRAQWAARPFVWQIYPQAQDAHLAKLDAFLGRYLSSGLVDKTRESWRTVWEVWNGARVATQTGPGFWDAFLLHRAELQSHAKLWSGQLDHAGNLANNLLRFVRGL